MGIAMSGTSVDQSEKYRTVLYYDTKDNIAHCAHYGKYSTSLGFDLRWLYTIS